MANESRVIITADSAQAIREFNRLRTQSTSSLRDIASYSDKVGAALGAIGMGTGLAAIVGMSDEYTKFTAQLRLATVSQNEYNAAYADVKRIATGSQQSLAGTGTLYARIANGTRELGTTQKQVADITETVNLALKVSGATATESASAQLQLSQAFASGTLRGEEFNAVNEAAPRLMKALADGMGLPIGALKGLAGEGKITSQIMADVLPKALGALQEEGKKIATIGGALTVLKDEFMELTAVKAQANGTVSALTTGIRLLSDNMAILMGTITTLTAAKLGTWMGKWVTDTYAATVANKAAAASSLALAVTTSEASAIAAAAKLTEARATSTATGAAAALATARVAELRTAIAAAEGEVMLAIALNGLIPAEARATALAEAHAVAMAAEAAAATAATRATTAATVALTAQAAAATLATRAMGVLRGIMAFMGGPIGLIITALGAAAIAWSHYSNKAKAAAKETAEVVAETTLEAIDRLDKEIDKLKERNALRNAVPVAKQANDADKDALAKAKKNMDDARNGVGRFSLRSKESLARLVVTLTADYNALESKIVNAQEERTVDKEGTRNDRIKDWRAKNGSAKERMEAELAELRTKFGSIPADIEVMVRAKYVDKGAASALKQEESAYKSLMTSIQEKLEANKLEALGYESMTDAQKMTVKLNAAILADNTKLSAGDIERARQKIALVAAEDAQLLSAKNVKNAMQELKDSRDKDAASAYEEIEANKLAIATYGMSKAQIEELTLARMEDRLARRGPQDLDLDEAEVNHLMRMIGLQKEKTATAGTLEDREKEKKAVEDRLAEQTKMWESVDQVAHDTFVSIFDSGKSAFDRLRDTLKNGLMDLLYQMTVKKWILSIGASVGLSGGVASLAQATTGGTGAASATSAGGLIGAAQMASSVYKAVTGGFSGLSGTITEAVQSGINALGPGTGMYSPASSGMPASGLAQGAGTVGSYAAGLAAGKVLGGTISGQYGIGGHGSAVVNISTIAGAIFGGPIGGAIGGAVGGLLNRAFGMGDKKTTAQGLRGTLSDAGATGESYSSWHQDGGWFRSDKGGTDTAALSADIINSLATGLVSLKSVSGDFAKNLDIDGAAIKNYSKSFDIALTADAAVNQETITKFFTTIGDEMATQLVPNIAQFALVGETASTTLQRLSGDFAATNTLAGLLGKTGVEAFGSMGMASAAARERLVGLTGGVAALGTSTTFFAQNFLTEAQRLAPVTKALDEAMASLGLSSIVTRKQFADTVTALDLTTAAGAQQFAAMMSLQEAFAQVHAATVDLGKTEEAIADERKSMQDQLNELTMTSMQLLGQQRAALDASNRALFDQVQAAKAVVTAKDALSKAYDTEKSAMTSSLTALKSWAATVGGLNDSLALGNQSILTPEQRYAEARAQFEKTLAAANAGDSTAQSGLSAAEQAFLSASQVVNASDAKYVADYARVMAANDEAMRWASTQVDVAQASLDALTAQVSGLITINDSVLTVAQAIANLHAAMGVSSGLGVEFTNGPAVAAPVAFSSAPAPVVFDAMRYSAGSNVGSDALVAEIRALNARLDAQTVEIKGLRADQAKQTGAAIQATVESNDKAAKTVVAGVDKSAKAAAWAERVEYSQ